MGKQGRLRTLRTGKARVEVDRLHAVYPARVELEPDPEPRWLAVLRRHTGNLVDNVADRWSLAFFIGALMAQIADTITTAIALSSHSLVEDNGLMRAAVTQPATVGALKMLAIALVCVLAMMRLTPRHARLALLLAFGVGAFAPLQNLVQLLFVR